MSLASARARLHGGLKELMAQWEHTTSRWNDPMSREVEKRFLSPLEPRVRSAITAMEKMEATLAQARRDCG